MRLMRVGFGFARNQKFIAAAILLIGLEFAALPVVWWRYAVHDFPFYAFVQDFLVPRMTLGWWIRPPVAREAPQEYVGNISMRPSKWAEVFPADIILGWRPAPNKIARHSFDGLYFITNAQGFSVVESLNERYAVPKPANVFRVVVVGGSTVMGAGVPDPRKALPAKLLEELRRAPFLLSGRKVEVINAGVAGYDISQEYLYLLTDLVQYEPDLVVAYHGWNDFSLSVRLNSMTMEESPFRKHEYPILAQRLNRSYTVLGNLLHMAGNVLVGFGDLWAQSAVGHILRSLGHRIGLDLSPKAKIEDIRFNPRSVEHFIHVMKAMISLGRDRGFKVALVLQPHGYTSPKLFSEKEKSYFAKVLNRKSGRDLARDFYAALRPQVALMKTVFAGDHSACIADVSDVFADEKETMYVTTGHLNEAGEIVVARRLIGELRSCRML